MIAPQTPRVRVRVVQQDVLLVPARRGLEPGARRRERKRLGGFSTFVFLRERRDEDAADASRRRRRRFERAFRSGSVGEIRGAARSRRERGRARARRYARSGRARSGVRRSLRRRRRARPSARADGSRRRRSRARPAPEGVGQEPDEHRPAGPDAAGDERVDAAQRAGVRIARRRSGGGRGPSSSRRAKRRRPLRARAQQPEPARRSRAAAERGGGRSDGRGRARFRGGGDRGRRRRGGREAGVLVSGGCICGTRLRVVGGGPRGEARHARRRRVGKAVRRRRRHRLGFGGFDRGGGGSGASGSRSAPKRARGFRDAARDCVFCRPERRAQDGRRDHGVLAHPSTRFLRRRLRGQRRFRAPGLRLFFPERFFFLERRRGPRLGARAFRARRVAERRRRRRRRRRRVSSATAPLAFPRFRVRFRVRFRAARDPFALAQVRSAVRDDAEGARRAGGARKRRRRPGRVAVGVDDVASVARATRRAVVRAPRGRSRVVLRAARAARLGERHLASPPQARGVVGELAGQVRPAVAPVAPDPELGGGRGARRRPGFLFLLGLAVDGRAPRAEPAALVPVPERNDVWRDGATERERATGRKGVAVHRGAGARRARRRRVSL